MADATEVLDVIGVFLTRIKKSGVGLDPSTSLFGGGLGLDSLEAAELSATLEDQFGTDPFTAGGASPQTLAEVLSFYEQPTAIIE